MPKRWMRRIAILTLVMTAACSAGWGAVRGEAAPSPALESFPLSEKWAAKLAGNVEQLSLADDDILTARTMRAVYALDIHSGRVIWQQDIAWHFSYEPVKAENGILFLTDGKRLLAMDQWSGETLWEKPLRYPANANVVDAAQGVVAVNDPPYLVVYQAEDGIILWEKDVCRERVQAYFFDTNIIVPCYGLTAVDVLSGKTVWERKSDDRIWKSAFADGVIYFSQDLETLTAFDVKNRKDRWITPLKVDRSQAFKVAGEHLFVTQFNQLCAVYREDGRVSWCVDGMKKVKPAVLWGEVVYLINGLRSGMSAFQIQNGSQLGRLDFATYDLITFENDKQLMTASSEYLIFAVGKRIYAYGK